MTTVPYSKLLTLLAIVAVANGQGLFLFNGQLRALDDSQLLEDILDELLDELQLRTDVQPPLGPWSDQLLDRSQPLSDDPIAITQPRSGYPSLPRSNPAPIAQPRQLPRSDPNQYPSIDRRLADLLQAQSQLRKELKKAEIQQFSQRQLIRDIDKLAESTAQFQNRLEKVREAQAQRLDRTSALDKPSAQIAQKPENSLVSQVLSAQHKSGTVIVMTP